ncbi:MAG TPA: tripartite tricarboxylate transporter substrate binding protein [Virgibacillus sp.]|nr:tripartite tricarboxylate transporter substrate binding protein [Virgibacillus sp.]HLR66996.1 tripartite tricarboxylate transporter substrate binding protein [Virgibacillus sp.]
MFKKWNFKYAITSFLLIIMMIGLAACSSSEADSANNDANAESELPENYPDKEIKAMVGFEAGGGQDVIMRTAGEILNEENIMDEPFVVENKPGAGGILAAKEVAKQKDDSYLLQVMPEYGAGWDPRSDLDYNDFKPVSAIATSDIYIVVRADSPYDSVNELFDALKEDDDLTISTLGPADGGEAFKWDQLRELIGADQLNFVPMEGAVDSFTAVLSGQVDVTFGVLPVIKDYVKKEEVKVLAVLSEERTEDLPDVPTLKESDIDFAYSRFTGIWTGADVSDAVVDYWDEKLQELTETEAWDTFLENRGLTPFYKDREEYTELVETEGSDFADYVENLEE